MITVLIILLCLVFVVVFTVIGKQNSKIQKQKHQLIAFCGAIKEISQKEDADNVSGLRIYLHSTLIPFITITKGETICQIGRYGNFSISKKRDFMIKSWEDFPEFHPLFSE